MFWNVQNIRIGPANRSLFYCVVLHRRTSYQFVSVPIGSYLIVVHSYRFVAHSHWDSPPVCCDSVRCNTMRNDRIVVLDRTCSHWFVKVPISSYRVLITSWRNRIDSPSPPYCFVLHRVAIVLHLITSHCIVSCLILVWFALIRK